MSIIEQFPFKSFNFYFLFNFQVVSGSSEEEESVPFIDDDSQSSESSKDKTDHATSIPKPTFLDLRSGKKFKSFSLT